MNAPDRFLLAIVAGILLLTGIGLGVAFWQEGPAYRADDRPENIVYNYLLAMQLRDYDRAYGYVSTALPNYPDISEFREGTRYVYRGEPGNNGASMGIEIRGVTAGAQGTTVEARVNHYYGDGLGTWWLDSGTAYSTDVRVDVERQPDGSWRITESDAYWDSCWHSPTSCE